MKILILTRNKDTCFFYRVENVFKHFSPGKYEVKADDATPLFFGQLETTEQFQKREKAFFDQRMEMIKWCDIFVMQRGTDDCHLKLIQYAKSLGKKTVYESDDLYTNVPTWNPGYEYFMQRQTPIRKMLQAVDLITVSTAELARYYQGFNKNIVVLPNGLDFDYFESCTPDETFPDMVDCSKIPQRLVDDICCGKLGPAPAEIMEFKVSIKEMKRRVQGRQIVLWSGSPTHLKDIEQIVGAMRKLTRSKDFVFVIGGFVEADLFRESYRGNMFLVGLVPMHNYYKIYRAIGADIVLAPVYPHPFNQCKSNLRVIEAMAMRSYPIASKYVTYAEWINKGRLAQMNESSWCREIEAAFGDFESGVGRGYVDDNERYVREHFDSRRNASLWMRVYDSLG